VGLNAYAIVYAALLVVFGRLADRFPREYGFLLGVAVFTVASALCAAANDTLALVVFRVVQAAGAALMTPTSLSMVLATSSGEERDNNVRAWTAIGGLMAALGPVAGGLARRDQLALGLLRQHSRSGWPSSRSAGCGCPTSAASASLTPTRSAPPSSPPASPS
jgi:MFS family permease